jgi:hypothetical protein
MPTYPFAGGARPIQPSPVTAMKRLTRRQAQVSVFFVGYLIIQLLLPLAGAGSELPKRLAWQMYSTLSRNGTYTVEHVNGTIDTIPMDRYVIAPRGEINWSERLPPHLCGAIPTAATVRISARAGTPEVLYSCR